MILSETNSTPKYHIICLFCLLFFFSSCDQLGNSNIASDIQYEQIPGYYFANGYLDERVEKIRESLCLNNGITFGFLSDLHIYKNASKSGNACHSPAILRYVMDQLSIPFVLFGGDVPAVRPVTNIESSGWDEIFGSANTWSQWMDIIGKGKVYQTRGNHDYLGYPTQNASAIRTCTPDQLYHIIMCEHQYDVVSLPGKMYYYFDVTNANLRVIVLDDYGDGDTSYSICGSSCIGQTQYNWLVNTALNCENKNIIVLSHQMADIDLYTEMLGHAPTDYDPNRITLFEILAALANKRNLSVSHKDGHGTVKINHDFRNDTNTLICHLCGHVHRDGHKLNDGVLTIAVTCDCWTGYVGGSPIPTRHLGTISEQAVSFISVDYSRRLVKLTRIGAGYDYELSY